jgi:DNA-binding PadR family transcriptional regulator
MLTELDYCILGIVWRGEPMTAYAVRTHLAQSTTATWSSSTGTVYPSIRRLREKGLIAAKSQPGPRNREPLGVTAAGKAAMKMWLVQSDVQIARATADPVRTRVHFLSALPPARRLETLRHYQGITGAAITELEAKLAIQARAEADQLEYLGTKGALAELRARLEWLKEVESSMPGD